MNDQTNAAPFDIDSLLDGTLDDLADLPEFKPFPPGTHRLMFSIIPDKELKSVYFAKLKHLETIELSNPTADAIPSENAETNVRYDLSNEYGQGAFKKALSSIAAAFPDKRMSNRELLEIASSPLEVLAVTKQNKNKKNGQVYTDIVELQVV